MSLRRTLSILILALLLAPFGRMGAAEAQPMPRHAAMQAPGHCGDQPQPANDSDQGAAIDCMIACAGLATAPEALEMLAKVAPALPRPAAAPSRAGIRPEADPPPPRFA